MNVTLAIHEHALSRARQNAVITSKEKLNYGQLDALIWRAASYFQENGLRQGDRVGLLAQGSLLHLVAALALSRLGVAYYAISGADPISAVKMSLASIDAKAVLVAGTGAQFGCPQVPISAHLFFSTRTTSHWEMASDDSLIWRFVASSGTTGRPKLFAVTHHNILAQIDRLRLALPKFDDDISMAMSNLNFFSPTRRVFRHLVDGGTIVLPGDANLAEICAMISNLGINRLNLGPWVLSRFLAEPAFDSALRKIKALETAGSPISSKQRAMVMERYTDGLAVSYGTNELVSISVAFGAECLKYPETIGRPIAIGQVDVVNEAGLVAPVGDVGQIRVRAPGMILGYWNDEDATAAAFRDGWFYPGDLASRTSDGALLFKGRADDMMIFDGINIYPSEIENCLMEHPAVIEVAAFALNDERHGNVPMAVVRIASPANEGELREFASARLGQRQPQAVKILQDFPRNTRGKIMTKVLASMFTFS